MTASFRPCLIPCAAFAPSHPRSGHSASVPTANGHGRLLFDPRYAFLELSDPPTHEPQALFRQAFFTDLPKWRQERKREKTAAELAELKAARAAREKAKGERRRAEEEAARKADLAERRAEAKAFAEQRARYQNALQVRARHKVAAVTQ